jgi:hypothetical protein
MHALIQNDDNNNVIMVGAALSLIAIAVAIAPVHEVNAKQCNSDINNDNNDQNNNSNDDGRTCVNKQSSNGNHGSSPTTDTSTPFVLSMPFP